MRVALASVLLFATTAAQADLRITRDTGGYIDQYKAKYEKIRDRGGRVVIDGVCNSACTMVLGIVPRERICVTPRASLGFHKAYYDPDITFGIKVTSKEETSELMSTYPPEVLAEKAGRADQRDQAAEEWCGIVEDRKSVPGRVLTAQRSVRRRRSQPDGHGASD